MLPNVLSVIIISTTSDIKITKYEKYFQQIQHYSLKSTEDKNIVHKLTMVHEIIHSAKKFHDYLLKLFIFYAYASLVILWYLKLKNIFL